MAVFLCFYTTNEPLEGVDFFDVLLDMNESVDIRNPNPGYRHHFVGHLFHILYDSCSRSTCRHVDPFKILVIEALGVGGGTASCSLWLLYVLIYLPEKFSFFVCIFNFLVLPYFGSPVLVRILILFKTRITLQQKNFFFINKAFSGYRGILALNFSFFICLCFISVCSIAI